MSKAQPMPLIDSLHVLRSVRDDAVVVTAMAAAREWMALGPPHPLDFVHVPSSMGQTTALGLGLALARPDRRIVVCTGDGSLLMNLGSLVTITAQAPKNLTVIVFDNGVYEVTGAQQTPGSAAVRRDGREIDYIEVARGCGFRSVYAFEEISAWRDAAAAAIDATGPTYIHLKVAPLPEAGGPKSPSPGPARAAAFAAALERTKHRMSS